MEKSIATKEYRLFLRHLRHLRKRAGLTQVQLAERLGEPQSFVSKCEAGERRIDLIELRAICEAMDVSFITFIDEFDQAVQRSKKRKRSR